MGCHNVLGVSSVMLVFWVPPVRASKWIYFGRQHSLWVQGQLSQLKHQSGAKEFCTSPVRRKNMLAALFWAVKSVR